MSWHFDLHAADSWTGLGGQSEWTPLHETAPNNSVGVAELLIATGASVGAKNTPLTNVSCHFGLLLLIRGLALAGRMGRLLWIPLLTPTWSCCSRQLVLAEFSIGTAHL